MNCCGKKNVSESGTPIWKLQTVWNVRLCCWASSADVARDRCVFMFRVKQYDPSTQLAQHPAVTICTNRAGVFTALYGLGLYIPPV
jgi:hypothetical protein